MTVEAKNEHFYEWFKEAGGNMITQNPEKLNKNLHAIPLQQASTLKIDPELTKQKHNYKFKELQSI